MYKHHIINPELFYESATYRRQILRFGENGIKIGQNTGIMAAFWHFARSGAGTAREAANYL